MNTCGTCKYFGRQMYPMSSYDEDGNEVSEAVYHLCDLMQHLNGPDRQKLWPLAGVTDGSGYVACFCVMEEFGCNQWKAK